MTERKVLYSIFVPPGRARTVLDAIRLFAKPSSKYSAHVTVRGPYPDLLDPTPWSGWVRGQLIEIGGVGTFFEGSQNTVYLSVYSPAIRAVWDKPDYPDYNPHLTVYDGPSRVFAESLRSVLIARNPRLSFHAEGLEPMQIGNGYLPLRESYDPAELGAFLTRPPTMAEIDAADDAIRLSWIAELADHLTALPCGV